MWRTSSNLLADIMSDNTVDQAGDTHVKRNSRDIYQVLQDHFSDIKRRNEAMLFQILPIHKSARLGSAVSDVKVMMNLFLKLSERFN